MSWPLLKVEVEVGADPRSFCKTMGFVCANLRCHILISDGDSCHLIVGGSPRLLRFFEDVTEEVGVAVAAAGGEISAGTAVVADSIMYRLLTRWP